MLYVLHYPDSTCNITENNISEPTRTFGLDKEWNFAYLRNRTDKLNKPHQFNPLVEKTHEFFFIIQPTDEL